MKEPGTCAKLTSGKFRRARASRFILATVIAVCAFPMVIELYAQPPKPTEYEVEAAYLSNFGRFVEWPGRANGAGETFNICVLGQDPFGLALDGALKGESINGAPMAPKRIAGPDEASSCRILFISTSKDNQLDSILRALGTSRILTVSDMAAFTDRGGMIQFVLDGNRVRFQINIAAAQRARLSLSSQLLKLALNIRRSP
jgi:hypothetical protein